MKRPVSGVTLLVASALLLVCSPPSAASPPRVPGASCGPTPVTASGTLSRGTLEEVLRAGPGRLLGRVPVRAEREAGRWTGWRIEALFPGEQLPSDLALRVGDVLQRVNGRRVERPEQLMAVWEQLAAAPSLCLEGTRQGRPLCLCWTIVDGPGIVTGSAVQGPASEQPSPSPMTSPPTARSPR